VKPSFIKLHSDLQGILYIEDTGLLFLGAGTHCSCFSLIEDKWLWNDSNILDFVSWMLIGDAVIMKAEREVYVGMCGVASYGAHNSRWGRAYILNAPHQIANTARVLQARILSLLTLGGLA